MGQTWPLFVYFRPFLNTMKNIVQNLTIYGISIVVVLGIRTRDCRIVGADESTELGRTKVMAVHLPLNLFYKFVTTIENEDTIVTKKTNDDTFQVSRKFNEDGFVMVTFFHVKIKQIFWELSQF